MEELQRENPSLNTPDWIEDKKIHEVRFCSAFLAQHPMVCINGTFFTKEGRVTDENRLRKEILEWIEPYVTSGLAKKVPLMQIMGCVSRNALQKSTSWILLS